MIVHKKKYCFWGQAGMSTLLLVAWVSDCETCLVTLPCCCPPCRTGRAAGPAAGGGRLSELRKQERKGHRRSARVGERVGFAARMLVCKCPDTGATLTNTRLILPVCVTQPCRLVDWGSD